MSHGIKELLDFRNICTPWTIQYEFQYVFGNNIELEGILIQSIHIAADIGCHNDRPIQIADL